MWIPTWLLWLGIGLFLGYWIGIFVAIREPPEPSEKDH